MEWCTYLLTGLYILFMYIRGYRSQFSPDRKPGWCTKPTPTPSTEITNKALSEFVLTIRLSFYNTNLQFAPCFIFTERKNKVLDWQSDLTCVAAGEHTNTNQKLAMPRRTCDETFSFVSSSSTHSVLILIMGYIVPPNPTTHARHIAHNKLEKRQTTSRDALPLAHTLQGPRNVPSRHHSPATSSSLMNRSLMHYSGHRRWTTRL